MYVTGAESFVPAYVTTDGLEQPQDCSAVAAGQWWVGRSTVISITPPTFSPRRNREKEKEHST